MTKKQGKQITKAEFDMSLAEHLHNARTKKGLELFEKNIGRIAFLHKESDAEIKGEKKYVVLNLDGEAIFVADRLHDVAKELCMSVSQVSCCIRKKTWLKQKYFVVRCGNE